MARMDGEFTTVTVLASWAAARPDGTTALVLNTKEAGPIAFSVDRKAIAALRRDLAACEQLLSQPRGQA